MNSELQVQLCRLFKVEWKDVAGRSKRAPLPDARHAYCFASWLITGGPDNVTGKEIRRHRTNVTRSVLKAKSFLDINEEPFTSLIYELLQQMKCSYEHSRPGKNKLTNQNLRIVKS